MLKHIGLQDDDSNDRPIPVHRVYRE